MKGTAARGMRDMSVAHWAMENLPSDASCIDIGCHGGEWLTYFQRYSPDGRSIGFEPLPYAAEGLRAQFPTCEIHELALANSTGFTEFLHVQNDPGWSGLRVQERYMNEPDILKITVAVNRLDNVCANLDRLDFIKIDVEGAELDTLRGGEQVINRFLPMIYFEHAKVHFANYGYTSGDLFDFLNSLGYKVLSFYRLASMNRSSFIEAVRYADTLNYDYHAETNFLAGTPDQLLRLGYC